MNKRFALLIVIGIFYVCSPNFRWSEVRTEPYGGDFLQEWIGAKIAASENRNSMYDLSYVQRVQHDREVIGFEWSEDSYFPLVYPPFYYGLLSPLANLPIRTAALLWASLMVGCFWCSLTLFEKVFPLSDDFLSRRLGFPSLLLLAVLFPPLVESLITNQKSTVCLAILTGAYSLLRMGRPTVAGLVFGLIAFKPQLVFVIGLGMLWKRQWHFLIGMAGTLVALAIYSYSMGWNLCLEYVRFCTGALDYSLNAGYDLHESHCVQGFFTLLLGHSLASKILVIATSLCVIGTMLLFVLRGPLVATSNRFAMQFSWMVIATVLLSPHLYTYDLTMLLLPFYALTVMNLPRREEQSARIALGYVVTVYSCTGISELVALHYGWQFSVLLMTGLLIHLLRTQEHYRVEDHLQFGSG